MRGDESARTAVRPYRPEDLDPVVELWYATWHATFPDLTHHEPKDEWRRRFETEIAAEEQVFVAEVDGQLAGFLALKDRGGGQGYLHEIFVEPEYQHRGIGSILMRLAKELAPAGLRLHTLQRNARAAAFYERHGFTVLSTGIGRVGLPNALYVWEPPAKRADVSAEQPRPAGPA
ncbi:MAG: GNAT family N-acetyltransferase [Chloroflexota bacterium]